MTRHTYSQRGLQRRRQKQSNGTQRSPPLRNQEKIIVLYYKLHPSVEVCREKDEQDEQSEGFQSNNFLIHQMYANDKIN